MPPGRDLTVSADAFSEDGRRSSIAIAEAVPGVRLVRDQTRIIDEAKPFTWSAERNVSRLTLVRQRLACRRSGRGSTRLRAASPAASRLPTRWRSRAACRSASRRRRCCCSSSSARLRDGKVTLSDTSVRLSGIARDLGGREAIAAALRNLPEGYTVAENAVSAPPYVFQVNKDPVAATLTLNGYVPDNAVHAALIEAAKRKFLNEKIVDNLKASVGAPNGFANAVPQQRSARCRGCRPDR